MSAPCDALDIRFDDILNAVLKAYGKNQFIQKKFSKPEQTQTVKYTSPMIYLLRSPSKTTAEILVQFTKPTRNTVVFDFRIFPCAIFAQDYVKRVKARRVQKLQQSATPHIQKHINDKLMRYMKDHNIDPKAQFLNKGAIMDYMAKLHNEVDPLTLVDECKSPSR